MSQSVSTTAPEPSVEVFAVYGVEPEIQAYAMAKYSRSSLSMRRAKGNYLAEGGKILNTSIFNMGTVRLPTLRTSRWLLNGFPFSRYRRSRRAALGRTGALDSLSGLQEERLLHSELSSDASATSLYRETIACLFAPTKKFRSGPSNISPALLTSR